MGLDGFPVIHGKFTGNSREIREALHDYLIYATVILSNQTCGKSERIGFEQMTNKAPTKLPDGGYLFPDGITVSFEKITRGLIGVSKNNIDLFERASGKDIYLLQAEIIHDRIVAERQEEERRRLEAEEKQQRQFICDVNAGKRLVEGGLILVIKDNAVLTAPELTDAEYRALYHSSFNLRGCYADKMNFPAYEVRLPDRYPEYRIFILWSEERRKNWT